MIEIRMFRSKRRIRVDLHRKARQTDKAGRVKYTYKQIGSFPLTADKSYPAEIHALLDAEEKLQLKNWLAETTFAEQFNAEPDELEKIALRLPAPFHAACIQLSEAAEKADLHFIPSQVMLEALLQKARLVENKLNKLGHPSHHLENLGISTQQIMSEADYERQLDRESRVLFKALLELRQPIAKTCLELETVAKRYGKTIERIPPKQIEDWAGVLPHRQPKKINRWYFAAAIEVLLQHQINPLKIAKPEKVAHYWALQYQPQYSLAEAKHQFNTLFHPAKEEKPVTEQAIEAVYRSI